MLKKRVRVGLNIFLQILVHGRTCLLISAWRSIRVSRTTPCATAVVVGSVSVGAAFVIGSGKMKVLSRSSSSCKGPNLCRSHGGRSGRSDVTACPITCILSKNGHTRHRILTTFKLTQLGLNSQIVAPCISSRVFLL